MGSDHHKMRSGDVSLLDEEKTEWVRAKRPCSPIEDMFNQRICPFSKKHNISWDLEADCVSCPYSAKKL